jgi:hypothetical protein
MVSRLFRYKDLRKSGIVTNWVQLRRLQDLYGFPKGFLLSPQTRVWREDELDSWLAMRPTEGVRPALGIVKVRLAAKKAREAVKAKEAAASEPPPPPPEKPPEIVPLTSSARRRLA